MINNGPIEQVWFQNEYIYLLGYILLFILPATFLLLGSIYKPKSAFYALTNKRFNLTETSNRNICMGLLALVIGGYIIGNFRLFDGIGILPNGKVEFYYFHPAKNKIVDSKGILSYEIIPDVNNNDNNIGYLEIQLKDGSRIRSKFLTEKDKDNLNSAIQILEKLKIKGK